MKNRTFISYLLILPFNCQAYSIAAPNLKLASTGQNIALTATISQEEYQWLKRNPIIHLGVSSPSYPPFTIINEKNELEGVSADNLNALQKKLGTKFEIYNFKSRELAFDALKRREIDLIDAVTPAEAKEHRVAMTSEYSYTRVALFSKTGSLLGLDLDSPSSIIAVTDNGLVNESMTARFGNTTIKHYTSPYHSIASVLDGETQVYLGDTVSTNYLINQSFNNLLVKNINIDNTDTPIGFGIMPDNHVLDSIISNQLSSRNRCQKFDTLNWWVSTTECYRSELNEQLTSDEIHLLNQNKTFRIAVDEDTPPYALFDNNGQFGGTMSDILELVRLNSGLNFTVIRTNSMISAQKMLDSGKADLAILFNTNALKKKYLLSQPITATPYTVITRINDNENYILSNSKLKTIAIPNYSSPLKDFITEKYPNLNIRLAESNIDALNMVRNKQADFTITSTSQARYYLSYKYDNVLKSSGVLTDINALISIAATTANSELISIIQKSLMKISPQEISIISGRWRANAATDNLYWEGVSLRLYQLFSGLFVLLLATCIWIVYLRKLIFKKTTIKKAIQDRLSLVQNIINSIPQAVYVRDMHGQLLLFNTSYAQALAPNATHNSDSMYLDSLLDSSILLQWKRYYSAAIATGAPVTQDQRIVLNDRMLDIYHWIQPLRDDKSQSIGVVCGWLDISDRLKIIEQIHQAKAEADKANSAKTVFLATMSHEIRTPMNAIIGMLELAMNQERDTSKVRESIQIAHESALGLLEVLGGILDISSIESGQTKLHLEATTLRDIVDSAVDIFHASAEKKGLWIKTNYDHYADQIAGLDRVKVKQVLSNLLSNAIKFTENGGLIVYIAGNTIDYDNFEFAISVQDTGPGISPSEMSSLFIPFYQNNVSQNSGAGIGLSIAKSLSQIMGGDLLVTSVVGTGTTMTFKGLAVNTCQVAPKPNPPTATPLGPSNTRLNILIVDDHVTSLKLLQEQIELLGHIPLVANDGLEALFTWEDHNIDFVITDCNMPELDGIGLTEEIRKLEQKLNLRPCRIIGITASARDEDRQACLNAGMNKCVLKPVSLHDLSQLIPYFFAQTLGYSAADGDIESVPTSKRQDIMAELLVISNEDLLTLNSSLESNDYESMASIAHKLKSSAKLMQSTDLWDNCEQLEKLLSEKKEHSSLQNTLLSMKEILKTYE